MEHSGVGRSFYVAGAFGKANKKISSPLRYFCFFSMTSQEIRTKFLEFFKHRGHAVVPSSSLIPDDPSVLLTTAGMQQFKKYYTGEADALKDFGSKNTVSIQKSFRTSDIDEVGDESHLTFFEMLGNFSFGGSTKKDAITYAYEFITKILSIPISYVTVFEGSHGVAKDEESKKIWNDLGVTDVREEGINDVFWGPTGTSGPCGPTTEIYCRSGEGQDIEIWNLVFNEFFYPGSREELLEQTQGKELQKLSQSGLDTGMGFERLVMLVQRTPTIYETDLFASLMALLPDSLDMRTRRILSDHSRAVCFLISDGVVPSNKERGYILRRLMRRIITHEYLAEGAVNMRLFFEAVLKNYSEWYPELNGSLIAAEWNKEKEKFLRSLSKGLKELGKLQSVSASAAFKLYESYGLPYEIIKELGGEKTETLQRREFEEEFKKHQDISRAGLEKKFGGHGLLVDTGELKAANQEELGIVTRLHTATHILHYALRAVLGESVHQAGSDITVERTRFDFTFERKLIKDEIRQIEDIANDIVKKDVPVSYKELSKEDAEKTGALFFFKEKYPDRVKVYYIGNSLEDAVSKEFCGGPHVTHTGEIGTLKIIKEEACSAGVRRIRATLF